MVTKKELANIIKDSLEKDKKFKKFYAELSEKEKENLKRRFLEGVELHNLIFSQHSPYVLPDLEEEAQYHLRELIFSRGYKKVTSKKAKLFTKGRAFIFRIRNYLVGVKVNEFHKKYSNCSYLVFLEIPTKRGNIYADLRKGGSFCSGDTFDYVAYTAHFFDRYKERLNLEGDRETIIKKFMKTELENTKKGSSLQNINPSQVVYNLNKGLALGVSYGEEGILLKTFVSDNEINSYQEKLKEELDEMMLLNDLGLLEKKDI